ncbi:MAG: heme-binding protein [Gemmatimonadetes bacterium]|nr:heme-binding protein [Gemmatimonadota bacterium]
MRIDSSHFGFRVLLALALLAFGGMAPAIAEAQLTFEMAETAMDAAEAEARANGWNLTILITDAEGVPVYLRRMDGASHRTHEIASMKCFTVLTIQGPSGDYGRGLAAGTMDTIPGAIGFDGGLPIMMNGEIIGAMAASGARGTEDAQVVRAGLAAMGADPIG